MKKGDIVMVEWYDAQDQRVEKDRPLNKKVAFAVNTSYGKIKKNTKDIFSIVYTETTASNEDILSIPKSWIKKITKLKEF